MVYPPKREWCWPTICVLFVSGLAWLFVMDGLAALISSNDEPPGSAIVRVALWSVIGTITTSMFVITRYEITESELIVRWGLKTKHVPLPHIFAVESSRGQWGMPAWSRDALKIRFHTNRVVGDFLIITPRDKSGFLAELEQRAAGLRSLPPELARRASTNEADGVAEKLEIHMPKES